MVKHFKYLIIILIFCIANKSFAQLQEVHIGINGLTCAQCSRSVELSIRKLDFVKDVKMNLQHTNGIIYLKQTSKTDVSKIAQAVNDAGFSVRYLQGVFLFNHLPIQDNFCFENAGNHYEFIKVPQQVLDGAVTVKFIGDKYLPKKEIKKWQPAMVNNCKAANLYFVSL